ncbi:hypothetical protein AXE77_00130 [Gardnerella vaginalis]|uniref:LysM domain-containing protein n=2 Tax=Gardnerella vaginalis TaxID=2702 RepID=A0A3E1J0U8_GARVA|nr:hypothetical protein AXE77_00130 [Gardnerella vaginalis]
MNVLLQNSYRTRINVHRQTSRATTRSRRVVSKSRRATVLFCIFVLFTAAFVLYTLMIPRTAVSAIPEKFVTYTVRPGDTLWNYATSITPKNGNVSDSVDKLVALNHLSSEDLQIGQSINVPVINVQ